MSAQRPPKPGGHVWVQFGPRVIDGTVTRVRGDYMNISVTSRNPYTVLHRFVRIDSIVTPPVL